MKDYQCSCYMEYPNVLKKHKNGNWVCVDKYEKCESWQPNSIYGCKTHCRRKEAKGKEMNEDTKTYNGHTYSGNLLSACVNGYKQGRTDREKEIIDLIYFFEKTWNKESHKRVPHKAITELVEFIMQNDTSESVERWLKEQK